MDTTILRCLYSGVGFAVGVGIALCAVGSPLFGTLLLGAAAAAVILLDRS